MNISAFLKPLITLAVALGLGALLLFVGLQFAAPHTVEQAAGTEIVPVVAPVAVGDETPADDAEGAQLAEREVNVPGDSDAGVDPATRAIIDDLTESADPATEIMDIDGAAEADDSSVDDDSCAPRDDDPRTECPEGLRSTILPLIHLRDFGATVYPFPVEHGVTSPDCSYLEETDTISPMLMYATAPGEFRIEVSPLDDPTTPTITVTVGTEEAQRTAYNNAIAHAETIADVPIMRECFTVPSLTPDTNYIGVVTGVADDARVMSPYTFHFNSGGAPVHPSLQLVTVGENLLFASALHLASETVDIRAYGIEADATPDCAAAQASGDRAVTALTTSDTEISEDRVTELNVIPGNTHQRAETFVVMPGATVIICARWFNGDGSHSWEREQPTFESSAIAQAPDRLIPTLTIANWRDGSASPLHSVEIMVATPEGSECGGTNWTPDDPTGATGDSAVVCWPTLLGASGVRSSGGRIWDLGFAGDLVVRGRVELDSGFSEASMLLPAVNGGCRGVCTVPEPHIYRIRMAGVDVDLVETWAPGGNGRATWNRTATIDDAPDYVRPDIPQLDTGNDWSVTPPVWGQNYVDYAMTVAVDRPVDYVLTFGGSAGAAPRCTYGGTIGAGGTPSPTLQQTGHIEASSVIRMRGVCLGGYYDATLQLTDADGHVATWGVTDRRSWWGSPAIITAPLLPVHLNYFASAPVQPYSRVQQFDMSVGTGYVRLVNDNGNPLCPDGRFIRARGSFDTQLGATSLVLYRVDSTVADGWTPTSCERTRADGVPPRENRGELSLIDLFRMGDATLHFGAVDPATGGDDAIRLYLDGH